MRLLMYCFLILAMGTTAAAEDPGWPRELDHPKATVIMYQPQPDSLRGNQLWGRTAVSVKGKNKDQEPVFGAVWFRATLSTDRDARLCWVESIEITDVRFPNAKPEQVREFTEFLEAEIPKWHHEISYDRLLASLDAAEMEQKSATGLKNEPPRIFFETGPAILISIAGDPELRKIENTSFMRVVNTAFPILFDPASKAYYLYGTVWYSAPNVVDGPWTSIEAPPGEIAKLVAPPESGENTEEAPEEKPDPATLDALKHARILVSTVPAELIVSQGEPKYSPLGDGDLLYMANTESDVFMEVATQQHYLLLSGRWFKGPSMAQGPWTFVPPDQLPPAFAAIPPASKKGSVLSFIPGTQEAREAYLDTQVPQTAAVQRGAAKLEIEYDGDPKFEAIEGTKVAYAVNTGSQVLRINGKYYACEEAVWYVSDAPTGPWTVSESRPDEVDDIPPSSPVYNTKYVYVYHSTPSVVYVGYYPGYVGCYPYYGTVVYGTGWYYPPYVGPVYCYPRPVTYGFHVHYNSYTGWSFGMSWGVGWAGFSYGWGPSYGYHRGYSHGYNAGFYAGWRASQGGWYGPGGYRPKPTPYSREMKGQPATRDLARGGQNLYEKPGNADRNVKPTRPAQTPDRAGQRPNNVVTDRDGNIYRKGQTGWEQRTPDGWTRPESRPSQGARPETRPAPSQRPETRPAPSQPSQRPGASPGARPVQPSQLDRQMQSRDRGAARTQNYQRSSPPPSRGARGGGGRR